MLTKIVEDILKVSYKSRNTDKELYLYIFDHYGIHLTESQKEIFRNMPSLESVRRVRQKLQEGGKYQADQKIKKERDWKALRMQQNTPTAKPKVIENIMEQRVLPWGEG